MTREMNASSNISIEYVKVCFVTAVRPAFLTQDSMLKMLNSRSHLCSPVTRNLPMHLPDSLNPWTLLYTDPKSIQKLKY